MKKDEESEDIKEGEDIKKLSIFNREFFKIFHYYG